MDSKRFLAALLALFCAIPFFAPTARAVKVEAYEDFYVDEETGLLFYKLGELGGLMTFDNEQISPPMFWFEKYHFSEGMAAVTNAEFLWGYIDTAGDLVVPFQFELAEDFSEGLACVRFDEKYGYIDMMGEWVVPPKYDYASSFQEGLAVVGIGAKYWYIDGAGNCPFPDTYRSARPFANGIARVYTKDGSGLINRKGEMLLSVEGDGKIILQPDGSLHYEGDGFNQYYALTENGYVLVPEVGSAFDMADYYPNEGEKVARLDGKPTLTGRASREYPVPRIDGATALLPVYAALVQATYPDSVRFQAVDAANDDGKALFACTKTGTAYERLVGGKTDIIFVAGPSDQQVADARAAGVEFVLTPIAKEAFVFMVNRGNPVEGLTSEQLRGVYAGEIANWDALGAAGLGEIVAYQRQEGSGSQTALQAFMGDVPITEPLRETIVLGMDGAVQAIEYRDYPNAIGYSFRFYVTGMMQSDVKLLAVDGTRPTVENIASGAYPLVTQLYAVTRAGEKNPNVAAFLEWVRSGQGMELIEKSGYVPEY